MKKAPVTAKSKVSERGQTVIPNEVRKALDITPGATLHWKVEGEGRLAYLTVYVVPADPIRAARGMLKGMGLTVADLLEDRRREREREDELDRRWDEAHPVTQR